MSSDKINTRKIQAMETKKKIYDSADQLFKKYGFDQVSVDSIVEMAGVSKGSFYVHFDTKHALIAALATDVVAQVDLGYKTFLASLPDSSRASDLLILLAGKIADTIDCTLGIDRIKVIYEAQIARTLSTDAILGYNREIYQILNTVVNKGVQQGEFRSDIPISTITNHCVISLRGITYEWCIRYPDFNLKEQVLKHFEILLSGIQTR